MKGIIIATHGQLASGLKNAAEVIMGPMNQVEILQIEQNDSLDDFEELFLEKARTYQADGSLVLVDMIGGSPYNVAMKHIQSNLNFQVVSGVNLGMTLELLMNLESMTLTELSSLAMTIGQDSIQKFPEVAVIQDEAAVTPVTEEQNFGKNGIITLARVDHRLLHGQVVTKWSKLAQANTVIIVDDDLYHDEYMAEVYRSAAPVGMEVIIVPAEVIGYAHQNQTLPTGNVMLLFKDIEGVQRAYEEGLVLEKLQLGGVPNDGTKQMVFTAVSLSERDIDILNHVDEAGTEIELQVVPEESGISYAEAVKRFEKN